MERFVFDWEFMLVEMSFYKDSYYRKNICYILFVRDFFFKFIYVKLKLILVCKYGILWEYL